MNSAHRIVFWTGCREVASLTDAELEDWKARGVGGFVCQIGHLPGLGGTDAFRTYLVASDVAHRAQRFGIKMYLGVYLVNYWNAATPLSDWFDDAGWSNLVVPKMRNLAGTARLLGFAGVAFDQELYPQQGAATTASWDWDYPGNTRPEAEVRAKARQRGRELMSAIVGAFPGVELMAYDVQFPESWSELVQQQVNGIHDVYASRLDIDFWDGLLSVEGYGAIRLVDSIFYKSPHSGTWDNALQYNANRLASLFSRRLSNWKYASSRLFLSPFSWIDPGPRSGAFDDARPPEYVREQLLAFRRWSMGGEFANYVYGDLRTFDYSPYVSAMQEASTPAAVDPVDPTLTVTSKLGSSGPPPLIEGTAHDNLAIWAVRWHDNGGGSGVAKLSWKVMSGGDQAGYVWETQWSFPASDLSPGASQVTITAADITGHTSIPASLTWTRESGGGGASPPEPGAAPPGAAPSERIGGGGSSPSRLVDKRPPQTRISGRPHRRSRDSTPRFRFVADEPSRGFACRIDRGRWRACDEGLATYRLKPGWHVFKVRATDRAGNTDPTPARYRFKVEGR